MPKKENIGIKKAVGIVQLISKNNLHGIINEWLLFILKEYDIDSVAMMRILQAIATKHVKYNKELQITAKYLEIYQKYIIEKDKKAIYDLPKEQRLFFQKHILK